MKIMIKIYNQNEYINKIKREASQYKNSYISLEFSDSKIKALINWLSLQTIEIQILTFSLQDEVIKKLQINEKVEKIKQENIGKYNLLIICCCIEIMRNLKYEITDNNKISNYKPQAKKSTKSKEYLVASNIDIIENMIMQTDSHLRWSDIHRSFFKIIKPQLRGRDKLKRDAEKIMSLTYFIRTVKKYIFSNGERTADYFHKSDIKDLVDKARQNKIIENLSFDVFDSKIQK